MSAAEAALTISPAADGDVEAVDRLIHDAYEYDYGPRDHSADDFAHARVRVERGFDVWVARDAAGTIVGSVTTPGIGGEKLMEDARPEEFDFRLLGVSPAARHRHIGTALTAHVIAVARERGYTAVFMKSGPQMTGAHALYASLDFRRDPDRDGLILGGEKVFDLYAFVRPVDAAASAAPAASSTPPSSSSRTEPAS